MVKRKPGFVKKAKSQQVIFISDTGRSRIGNFQWCQKCPINFHTNFLMMQVKNQL